MIDETLQEKIKENRNQLKDLERYSNICDKCAQIEAGICLKQIVCYNIADCELCGKKMECLSVKDYLFPKDRK